jgi:hypothetical protein
MSSTAAADAAQLESGSKTYIEEEPEGPLTLAWRQGSYYWSTVLTFFGLAVMLYGVAKKWNNPPWEHEDSHPAFEIVLLIFMLTWIAMLEGCQISIVGLQGIDMEPYKHTHPRAYRCCKVVHKGANVERFLVGRQFLLLFNGFLASRVSGSRSKFYEMGDWVWDDWAVQFFWVNSALLMVVIIALCQLPTQLVAADKMLGFFNLPFGHYYFVVIPCLVIEAIGLTHSTYILKDMLRWATGMDTSEEDPKKAMNKNWLHYAKCTLSVSAVLFSGIFLVKGLALQQTGASDGAGWRKLPGWATILVTILFLFIMACSEGVQVSALALARTPLSSIKATSPKAHAICKLLFTGRNMQAFLIGRQTLVAMMMVLLGRATGYAGGEGQLVANEEPSNDDWGMGKGFNKWMLQTGFIGAIFVVNVAQLATQVTASIFPIAFINNHFMYYILKVMLFIEASGVVNACWPLSWLLSWAFSLKKDPFDDESISRATSPADGTAGGLLVGGSGINKGINQNILDRKKSLGIPLPAGEVAAAEATQAASSQIVQVTEI